MLAKIEKKNKVMIFDFGLFIESGPRNTQDNSAVAIIEKRAQWRDCLQSSGSGIDSFSKSNKVKFI